MPDKVAVIIGSATGMGKAVAKSLGRLTSRVVIADISDELYCTAEQLKEDGVECSPMQGDVSDLVFVKEIASKAQSMGQVAYVVNTSGVAASAKGDGPQGYITAERLFEINSIGVINVTQTFYPLLSDGGVLINFSSNGVYKMRPHWYEKEAKEKRMNAYRQWRSEDFVKIMINALPVNKSIYPQADFAYIMSKEFIIWFTQVNAVRFGRKNARIVSISPGSFSTPMFNLIRQEQPDQAELIIQNTPCGREGHPFEVASVVEFLCKPGGSYINGVDILVDGGNSTVTRYGQDQITD